MKIFIFGLSLLVLSACAGCIAWTSTCINIDRVTYGDSEAAYLGNELRQQGKHLLPQLDIFTVVDIPLHMQKFDQ